MSPTQCPTEMLCILFSDIVSSTPPWVKARREGQDAAYNADLYRSLCLWREALRVAGASFLKSTGDGVMAVFGDPHAALQALVQGRRALSADAFGKTVSLRVGLHIGAVSRLPDGDIAGPDAALGARIMEAAQGGQILVSESWASQIKPYLPAEYRLHDLGEARLRGFDTPVRLFQLSAPGWLEAALPPSPRSNLPPPLDRFVGRKRELRALRRYLADPVQRCVTLVGTGGCGKTRLALEVAREAQADFPDGVYFVALEESTEAGHVLARLASALSLSLSPNADILCLLQAALTGRRALLVLDNFEQALSAVCVVSTLLETLPALRLLVTSREPLQAHGERIYDLDPLEVPAPDASLRQTATCESVRLFVERVQAVHRQFKLTEASAPEVAAICRALSGLPLALEIVAAEARYRPLAQLRSEIHAELLDIERRLRDSSPRQRTLRATFEWSYRQLSEADRALFAQLGLFETAFSEADVYDVCTGADLGSGLRRLQDKSLICFDQTASERPYRLLIPLREYARDCLGPPTGAVRRRFIAAFTRKAQSLRDAYYDNDEGRALSGMRADLDNFRAAWMLACEDGEPQIIADLGMAVTFFAPLLPRATNLEAWLDTTLSALRRLNDTYRIGKLLNTRARLASTRGAFVQAVQFQSQALECLLPCGAPGEVADLHSTLAFFALRAQNYALAETHARQGIEWARKADDGGSEAMALYVLACVLTPSDLEQATKMAERSLALFQSQNQSRGIAHASLALAAIAEAQANLALAEARYRTAVRLCWEKREEVQLARCLEALARFYARCGVLTLADELLTAAAHAQRTLGMPETASLALPEAAHAPLEGEPPTLDHAVEYVLSAPPAFP
ncbi:MAG TPA: AAA family ATPase [Chthonomonadaceae bacterium]|nr:AAA family ATPase [Chthonomonadaceae bacterium]